MPFNANQLAPDSRIHALLVGPSGAGKTAAAASFEGKTHIIDFDDRSKGPLLGCQFLQDRVKTGQITIHTILPYAGTKQNSLTDVYSILESVDAGVNRREIDNVIVDGTTSMKRFFINDAVNNDLKTSGRGGKLAHFKIGEAV